MDPITIGLLAGAGMGALQMGEKSRQAKAQRQLAAQTALYSPWTGMKPDLNIENPSFMGTVGAGAITGGGLGAAYQGLANQQALTDVLKQSAMASKASAAAPIAQAAPVAQQASPWLTAGGPTKQAALLQGAQGLSQADLMKLYATSPYGVNQSSWSYMQPTQNQLAYGGGM